MTTDPNAPLRIGASYDARPDPNERRSRALWVREIARARETKDMSGCLDLHDKGVQRPVDLEDAFMSLFRRNPRLGEKPGPKEKAETMENAKRVVRAVYQARHIRNSERISIRDALQRVARVSGIDYERLARANEGSGTRKEKLVLREMRESNRTNY